MAVTYHINTDERVVYLTITGDTSFTEWRETMLEVLADPSYRPGFNFLSDRRQEADIPSTESAKGAAQFLKQHLAQMGRYRWAAVSSNSATYGMLRMFSIYSEMKGVQAEAFTDYEEARSWLLDRSSGK
jgi:hypothetical protein